LFEDIGASLPASTAFVVGTADFLRDYSSALFTLFLAILLYIKRRAGDHGWRQQWDRRWLGLPLIGDLVAKVEMARFSRSLGTLLRGGVPMLAAANIARASLENRFLNALLAQVSESLEEGAGLSGPLIEARVFPDFAVQMIQVGEETGQLDDMLLRVADVYDDEVATAVQRLLTVVEPVMIVGLGLLIGGIILSILSAILSINDIPF
jgi:general secretion pathway protein F